MSEGPYADFKTLKTVWGTMVAGTLAYTAVAYVLLLTETIRMAAFGPDVMNVVGALVLVQLAGSLLLRRHLVASIPDDLPYDARFNRYMTAIIVALALVEGGGLFLITFAIITGIESWALVGGGSSVVLMVMARPTEAELGS